MKTLKLNSAQNRVMKFLREGCTAVRTKYYQDSRGRILPVLILSTTNDRLIGVSHDKVILPLTEAKFLKRYGYNDLHEWVIPGSARETQVADLQRENQYPEAERNLEPIPGPEEVSSLPGVFVTVKLTRQEAWALIRAVEFYSDTKEDVTTAGNAAKTLFNTLLGLPT